MSRQNRPLGQAAVWVLFNGSRRFAGTGSIAPYNVTADGQRFVMVQNVAEAEARVNTLAVSRNTSLRPRRGRRILPNNAGFVMTNHRPQDYRGLWGELGALLRGPFGRLNSLPTLPRTSLDAIASTGLGSSHAQ